MSFFFSFFCERGSAHSKLFCYASARSLCHASLGPYGLPAGLVGGDGVTQLLLAAAAMRVISASVSASSWKMPRGRLPRVAHGPGRGAALLSWPEGRTGSAVPSPLKDVELAAIGWGSRSTITGDNEAHAFSVAAIDERGTRSIALGTSRRLACGDEEHASPAAAIDERGSSLNGCEQKFAAAVLLACSPACLLVMGV